MTQALSDDCPHEWEVSEGWMTQRDKNLKVIVNYCKLCGKMNIGADKE